MIELSHVGITYKSGAESVSALRDVSLCIPRGDFVFLVGPTGAGKSTLLKLLYRDLAPSTGTIRVAGRDLGRLPVRDVPKLRREMGIVLQDFGLLPRRNVWENIAFACHVLGKSGRETRKIIQDVLVLVGMTHRCQAFPDELSGGEQQRVAIARALVGEPPLLLADEPTGNLDPETGAGVWQVLERTNRRRGTTIVVATHDKAGVDHLRRRVVVLENGRVVRDEAEAGYGL